VGERNPRERKRDRMRERDKNDFCEPAERKREERDTKGSAQKKRERGLMRVNEERGAFLMRGCESEIFCGRNVYIYWCGNSVPSSYVIIQFRRFQHFVIEINFMFRLYSFNKFLISLT
jgi:hypothetical protein